MVKNKKLFLLVTAFTIFLIIGITQVVNISNNGLYERVNYRISSEDFTPPELIEFDFNPTTVDVSSSSQLVTFTLSLTDDLSGIDNANWDIISPSGSQCQTGHIWSPWDLKSGTENDGIYQTNVEFPQFIEIGTWHITQLTLVDKIGNNKQYSEADLITMGYLTVIKVGENQPPKANAGPQQYVDEGMTVIFDASGSTDPNDDLLQFRWDFDNDGLWDTDLDFNPLSEYTWFDDYIGRVVVEVSDGKVEVTDETTVVVNNVAPTASIDEVIQPFPDFILPSDIVEFHGSFIDPGVYDSHIITWDFGDDIASTDTLTPIHAYSEAGVYTVRLNIEDDDGGIGSASYIITVASPEEAVEEIQENVISLDLTGQSENSLVLKLEVAQNAIENGFISFAITQLNVFIRYVEVMQGKKLTNEEVNMLISAAQWLIGNLENNGS